jgi:hypothetical protein
MFIRIQDNIVLKSGVIGWLVLGGYWWLSEIVRSTVALLYGTSHSLASFPMRH